MAKKNHKSCSKTSALKAAGKNAQQKQQKSVTSVVTAAGKDAAEDAPTPTTNCPRNLLVTDATQPFTFSFTGRFGIFTSLTVNQTPDDDTWPGGSLWDAGVLLAQLFVALALAPPAGGDNGSCAVTTTTTTRNAEGKAKNTNRIVTLPTRVSEVMSSRIKSMQDTAILLELGCGVGLTGLVAAAAIGAKCTLLTDLPVVIDRVTEPNVVRNTSTTSGSGSSSNSSSTAAVAVRPRTINKGKGVVMATPLCWGDEADEAAVASLLESLAAAISTTKAQPRRKKKGQAPAPAEHSTSSSRQPGMPDVILIGDVAYQQTPGAASHFEDLLSTMLKFVHDDTIVVFGTRIRMPASVDLLELFLQHFDELVSPPLRADEIDSSLSGVKHNMAIHFLQRKKKNTGTSNEPKEMAPFLPLHAALA
jgi:predicted nicotinamide N-methyase